jgi:hypothetical protein
MRTIWFEIREQGIKGEALLLKGLRGLPFGSYRADIFSENKRTNQQNRYLHAVFSLCVKGLRDGGYDEIRDLEDAKWFYKKMYLKYEKVNEQNSEIYEVIRKTSTLSKDDMGDLIDKVRDHQLEWFGNYIPTPEEWKENKQKWGLSALAV